MRLADARGGARFGQLHVLDAEARAACARILLCFSTVSPLPAVCIMSELPLIGMRSLSRSLSLSRALAGTGFITMQASGVNVNARRPQSWSNRQGAYVHTYTHTHTHTHTHMHIYRGNADAHYHGGVGRGTAIYLVRKKIFSKVIHILTSYIVNITRH